jgi:ribonuclease HII
MGLKMYAVKGRVEAGVDEAGRGCLAGPVTAAAVIPGKAAKRWRAASLNDSKALSAKTREDLRNMIESEAVAWAVGWASVEEIEQINILKAAHLAMHRAIDALQQQPEFLLIDGHLFQPHTIPHACEIKGDGRFLSIAAASILAKTHRDELMLELDAEFPEYGWRSNKGYPTKKHKEALAQYAPTAHHRSTFNWQPRLL